MIDFLADISHRAHVILTMMFPLAARATLCQSNSIYYIVGMQRFLRRIHGGLRNISLRRCQNSTPKL